MTLTLHLHRSVRNLEFSRGLLLKSHQHFVMQRMVGDDSMNTHGINPNVRDHRADRKRKTQLTVVELLS